MLLEEFLKSEMDIYNIKTADINKFPKGVVIHLSQNLSEGPVIMIMPD